MQKKTVHFLKACLVGVVVFIGARALAERPLTVLEKAKSSPSTLAVALWWKGFDLNSAEVSELFRKIFANHDSPRNLAAAGGCPSLLADAEIEKLDQARVDLSSVCFCTNRSQVFDKYIVPAAKQAHGLTKAEALTPWQIKIAGRRAIITIQPIAEEIHVSLVIEKKTSARARPAEAKAEPPPDEAGQPKFCSFKGEFQLLISTLKSQGHFIPLDLAAILPILRAGQSEKYGPSDLTVKNGMLTLK